MTNKENKKLQLLNTLYIREKYENGIKYQNDSLIIIFRDIIKDEVSYMNIKEPKIDFYVANEEPEYNKAFIEKDKVTKHRVKYNELLKYIAENSNMEDFYYNCLRNKQFGKLSELHQLKFLFSSDINIEDFNFSSKTSGFLLGSLDVSTAPLQVKTTTNKKIVKYFSKNTNA